MRKTQHKRRKTLKNKFVKGGTRIKDHLYYDEKDKSIDGEDIDYNYNIKFKHLIPISLKPEIEADKTARIHFLNSQEIQLEDFLITNPIGHITYDGEVSGDDEAIWFKSKKPIKRGIDIFDRDPNNHKEYHIWIITHKPHIVEMTANPMREKPRSRKSSNSSNGSQKGRKSRSFTMSMPFFGKKNQIDLGKKGDKGNLI
jgi:hypothetical protein